MGRIAHERHIHFYYTPAFLEHWAKQTPEFKQLCEDTGRNDGYTGINVFYCFFHQYWAHKLSGVTRKEYKSTL